MKLIDIQKQKYGTMTNEEKRLNKYDLGHFRHKETDIEAMIPGIHNL